MSRKLDIIRAFYKGTSDDDPMFGPTKRIVKRIEKFIPIRNTLAHGTLARNSEGDLVVQSMSPIKLFYNREKGMVKVEDLVDFISELDILIEDVERYADELRENIPKVLDMMEKRQFTRD